MYVKTDGRSVTITNAYDDAGRLTGKTYSDGTSSVTVGYDDDGRKTSLVDGTGTTSYAYDDASRLTTRSAPSGASSVTYSYDAANRLSTRTLAGTSVTTMGYDNADRLTSVTAPGSLVTAYTYDNAGRMLTTTYPNASVQTKVYHGTTADLSSAITKTSGAVTLDSHSYTYKGDGRRLTETATNGDVITYGYDNAGQLTSEVRTGTTAYSISYTYDNAGNRATKVQGGVTDTYTYDNAEKLSNTSSKTYSYDNAGNLTSVVSGGVTTALTWDGEERLKTVSVGGTTAQTNTYNGLGQRTKKVEGANTFTFTLNDDAIDSAVLMSDGAASYIQSAAGLAGETRSGTSKYYSADALGTTRAITNSTQTKTDSLDTDGFGMNVAVTGTTPTPFGFAGQHGYQSDGVTGLMLLGHRYYDASIGRFISRDPIQEGDNWYAYCDNDPVNGVDPSGLQLQECDRIHEKIKNIQHEIDKRIGELREDIKELPERAPGDVKNPSLSRWGHRKILQTFKKQLELEKTKLWDRCGGDPPRPPATSPVVVTPKKQWLPPTWLVELKDYLDRHPLNPIFPMPGIPGLPVLR